MDGGASDAFVIDTPTKIDELWHFRIGMADALIEFMKREFANVSTDTVRVLREITMMAVDVVVPISEMFKFYEEMTALGAKYKCIVNVMGHASDGNLHTFIFSPVDVTLEEAQKINAEMHSELYSIVKKLHGAPTGEHGIGVLKKDFLVMLKGNEQMELMRRIKLAFDPNSILNPGKVV